MIDLNDIKVLIFDFGGVLINLNREASVRRFKSLGVNDADKLLNNYVQSGLFLKLESGMITPDEFRDGLRREYDLPELTDWEIDDALHEFLLDLPEEKLALLRHLKRNAYNRNGAKIRVVLLSNTNAIHFPVCKANLFEKDGYCMDDYFDCLYLSYEMKMSKPDDEIFLALLENENCKAHECYFLDDGAANIETARKLGFNTYLVSERENLNRLFDL